MNDDILNRLRQHGEWQPDGGGGKYWESTAICLEAADEIERLQASVINTFDNAADEIQRLKKELHRWETCAMVVDNLCGWDTENTLCEWCEANQ